MLRDPIFVNWSSISLPHYVKGSDYVPVTAFRIVTGLSDRIPRRQAFDAPLFGHNALVANHNEDFGVSHHGKQGASPVLILGKNTLMKSVAGSRHSAKCKNLILRNQETDCQGACCVYRVPQCARAQGHSARRDLTRLRPVLRWLASLSWGILTLPCAVCLFSDSHTVASAEWNSESPCPIRPKEGAYEKETAHVPTLSLAQR